MRLSLVSLVGQLLGISYEVRVRLDLLSLTRPSACGSGIQVQLPTLASSSTWACRARLSKLLLALHCARAYVAHILLLLCRGASSALILTLLLVLVLQQELLLLQDLDLVSVFDRGGSLGVWRPIRGNHDFLRSPHIFLVYPVFEVELLGLAQVPLGRQGVVDHVDVRILSILLTIWMILVDTLLSLDFLRVFLASVPSVSVS